MADQTRKVEFKPLDLSKGQHRLRLLGIHPIGYRTHFSLAMRQEKCIAGLNRIIKERLEVLRGLSARPARSLSLINRAADLLSSNVTMQAFRASRQMVYDHTSFQVCPRMRDFLSMRRYFEKPVDGDRPGVVG